MSTWKAKITEKGDALLAKMTQGSVMEITHAEVGAGQVDINLLKQQTSVSSMKQTATVEYAGYPADGVCALPVTITNEGVSAGFSAWQIGVFANDPDEGTILFFLAQAEDVATSIPSAALMPSYNTQIIFYVEYGDADSVNVTVNPANAVSHAGMENYVNAKVGNAKEDLAAHTADKNNPHGVTAEQIGLGNVDNTADNDKYVAYAQRAGSADKVQNALTLRLNGGRTEGSDMWTFDGSTGRTVNVTAAKVGAAEAGHTHTPASIGAAEAEHGHDAADINSGTMALDRLPLDELVNLYIWKKYTADPAVYTEEEVTNANITNVTNNYYYAVRYADKINASSGSISFDEYTAFNIAATEDADADAAVLKGKYVCYNHGFSTEAWYFIPSDAIFTHTTSGSTKYLTADRAIKLTEGSGVGKKVGIVASKTNDTYPTNGQHTDGYWYEYHKQLGE